MEANQKNKKSRMSQFANDNTKVLETLHTTYGNKNKAFHG